MYSAKIRLLTLVFLLKDHSNRIFTVTKTGILILDYNPVLFTGRDYFFYKKKD